jgi:hypothetical protein
MLTTPEAFVESVFYLIIEAQLTNQANVAKSGG